MRRFAQPGALAAHPCRRCRGRPGHGGQQSEPAGPPWRGAVARRRTTAAPALSLLLLPLPNKEEDDDDDDSVNDGRLYGYPTVIYHCQKDVSEARRAQTLQNPDDPEFIHFVATDGAAAAAGAAAEEGAITD